MDTGRGVCIESWLAHSPLPVRYPTSIQPVPYRDTGRAVCVDVICRRCAHQSSYTQGGASLPQRASRVPYMHGTRAPLPVRYLPHSPRVF